MDIRKILHLQPKQPAIDIDPTQGLPTGEFKITDTGDPRARAVANIAQISPTVLERAGAARDVLDQLPDMPPRPAESRSKGRGTHRHESQASDLMKHMLGGLSDSRVRRVMKERRLHAQGTSRPRRAI